MKRSNLTVLSFCLLGLATIHCVLSFFFVSHSFLRLPLYVSGQEDMPFQGRLLMVYILRATQHSHLLLEMVPRYTHHVPNFEPFTVWKLTTILVSLVFMGVLVLTLAGCAKRIGVSWWMTWALLLVILYVSVSARYEQALWYPYDLPHTAVFGLATIFLFIDEPWWFLAAVLLDCSIRETALFAVALALAMRYRQRVWQVVAAVASCGWVISRLIVHHLYGHNPHVGMPYLKQLRYLLPWHIPQLFSIVAFLPIPVFLARRYLAPMHRRGLIMALVIMLATFYFANWAETRVWMEWSTAFAIWAAMELTASKAVSTVVCGQPETGDERIVA